MCRPIDGCNHVGRKDNIISKKGHIATQHPDPSDDYAPESRNKRRAVDIGQGRLTSMWGLVSQTPSAAEEESTPASAPAASEPPPASASAAALSPLAPPMGTTRIGLVITALAALIVGPVSSSAAAAGMVTLGGWLASKIADTLEARAEARAEAERQSEAQSESLSEGVIDACKNIDDLCPACPELDYIASGQILCCSICTQRVNAEPGDGKIQVRARCQF